MTCRLFATASYADVLPAAYVSLREYPYTPFFDKDEVEFLL
jgi:hypothetical protein